MKRIYKAIMLLLIIPFCFGYLFGCDNGVDPELPKDSGWVTSTPPQREVWGEDGFGWAHISGSEPVFGDGFFASYYMSYEFYGDSEAELNTCLDEILQALWGFNDLVSAEFTNSEVYKFNNELGKDVPMEVSFDVYELVRLSKEYHQKTNGLFNPATYPLVLEWNVRGLAASWHISPSEIPTPQRVAEIMEYCDFDLVSCWVEDGKYYLSKSDARTMIELGAVSKGYGADMARKIALEHGVRSGLINISGNVVLINGEGKNNVDWRVALDQPYRSTSEFDETGRLYFTTYYEYDNSCVVSGDYQLYYIYEYSSGNKFRAAHIIDPRTGYPMNVYYDEAVGEYKNNPNGVIMANAIGPVSAICDLLTTPLVLMSMEEGYNFMSAMEGFKSIIVTADGKYTTVGDIYLFTPTENVSYFRGFLDYEFTDFSQAEG